jgi:hypothetical protein
MVSRDLWILISNVIVVQYPESAKAECMDFNVVKNFGGY